MKLLRLQWLLLSFLGLISNCVISKATTIVFVGNETNEVYQTLLQNNVTIDRFDDIEEAIYATPRGGGLIIVADNYPRTKVYISEDQYELIAKKNIRMYIEYPSIIPGREISNEAYEASLERGVITSNFFGKTLPPMSIIGLNGCYLIKMKRVHNPIISFAKVAGFDRADYGLEDTEAWPLLFIEKNNIICASSFSVFKQARYGPVESWKTVWERIIQWITRDNRFRIVNFSIDPTASFSENEELPLNARREAIRRGTEWIWKANFLIHPSREDQLKEYQPDGGDPNLFFGPPFEVTQLQGDGSRGIMEGHASYIHNDGTQKYRYLVRADVQGEAAFMLASAGNITNSEKYNETAEKILDYLFYTSNLRENNPKRSSYGLLGWATATPWVYYGDDNARCILGAIGASSLMNNQRWNQLIVENILANLRTASLHGFQGEWLHRENIELNGWKFYQERDLINTHPHFESWMWACYLWLYDKTGYKPLLEKAKIGIQIMMEAYPDRWSTQNGMQQERGRMILPLAWLVRVEDTPQHRLWLDMMISEVLSSQEPNGAIREELGKRQQDKYNLLVHSNADYGTFEAPLISKNGDKVADLLYTCNFIFFGLNEAYYATKEKQYKEALLKLSDFLVRIQVRSTQHPDLDGTWFRAFDYGRWDYWGSNADNGWGAWCTLTGWIQTWIVSTQAMIEKDCSYWDTTKNMDMNPAMKGGAWMLE